MPFATQTLKNDDATPVGSVELYVDGAAKSWAAGVLVLDVGGVMTLVGSANPLPISAASLPLPTGAATVAAQTTGNATLASIDGKVTACNTGAVVVSSSALPTGAAAEATLSALNGKLAAAGLLADNTANPSTTILGSCLLGFDGAAWDRVWTIADGDVVNAAAKGLLVFGHDGANYQALQTDAAGRVVVVVNGTVTATISGAVDTELPAAAALADATANPTTPTVGSALLVYNGATWDRPQWNETNRCKVNPIAGQAGVQGNSGVVTALTQRVVLATDVGLPAGTALIGKAAVAPDAKVLYDGTTPVTVKYANIDTATSGNNAIVAAVANKKIKVVSVFLAASGAVDVYWNDGTVNLLGGTRKIKLDNTGAVGAGGFCLQENKTGWFETAAVNRPLNLNLSAAIGVAGCLAYVEVDG